MRLGRQQLAALGAACAVIAAAGYLGWRRAEPPKPCAEGMVALRDEVTHSPRCCGQGQALHAGACQGPPASCATGMRPTPLGCVPERRRVALPGGRLRLGNADWEAERVLEPRDVDVAPFELDSHEVTAAEWQPCQADSACVARPSEPEPGRPVVNVTRGEAAALCRWRGGRLPSSAELSLAAMGSSGRRYPWGETGAVCRRAAFGLQDGPCAYGATGPELSGSHPSGATPEGIYDLAGNVAEWTAPEPGAEAELAEVRGGSWQDPVASALRSWNGRLVPAGTRSPAIGFRCAYPAEPSSGAGR